MDLLYGFLSQSHKNILSALWSYKDSLWSKEASGFENISKGARRAFTELVKAWTYLESLPWIPAQ